MALTTTHPIEVQQYVFHLLNQDTSDPMSAVASVPRNSTQRKEKFLGTGAVDPMEEDDSAPMARDRRPIEYEIANVRYRTSMRVTEEERIFNDFGSVEANAQQLQARYFQHWRKLIVDLMDIGESALGYDEVPFFATDHQEGDSGQQSNLLEVPAASGTSPDSSEIFDAVYKAIELMVKQKDDVGEFTNVGVTNFSLFYGPDKQKAVETALESSLIGGGNTNTIGFNRTFSHFVMPEFAASTNLQDSMIICANDGRSFIRQQVNSPEIPLLSMIGGPGSDHRFKTGEDVYRVRAMRGCGYGAWQSALKVNFT